MRKLLTQSERIAALETLAGWQAAEGRDRAWEGAERLARERGARLEALEAEGVRLREALARAEEEAGALRAERDAAAGVQRAEGSVPTRRVVGIHVSVPPLPSRPKRTSTLSWR